MSNKSLSIINAKANNRQKLVMQSSKVHYFTQHITASLAAKCFFGPIFMYIFCRIIINQFITLFFILNWQILFIVISGVILTLIYFLKQFHKNKFYFSVIFICLGLSLTFIFGLHLALSNFNSLVYWNCLGIYIMIFSFFHFGEFQMTALIHRDTVTIDSFLLNHSLQYHLALLISLIEFFIECYLAPHIKFMFHPYLTYFGLFICLFGEILRKLAMFTAGRNFNHTIQTLHQSDHCLVTHGIYSIFRHPSYVGWFYWSLGTQIIIQNPFSFFGYAFVSWNFFKQRIQIEEITLINFFGSKYLIYKKKVPTGLPWIEGF